MTAKVLKLLRGTKLKISATRAELAKTGAAISLAIAHRDEAWPQAEPLEIEVNVEPPPKRRGSR